MNRIFSRRDLSILVTNLLDHFDGALYGFLAPIMAKFFFPHHDPIIQIILAYSLFATSLFTRPIGAIIFGYIAKKRGPIISMSYSIIGVGVCSVLVGLIPAYDMIGYLAALLLIILRFIKGIFSAGESAIAKLYILDGKDNDTSYKASYLYQASSIAGIILASACSTIVYLTDNPDFWRICYILGGVVGFSAYLLRKNKDIYHAKSYDTKIESINFWLIWKYRMPILAIIFTTGLSHLTYLVPCVIMNSLIPFVTDIEVADMMKINNLLLILDMFLILLIGPIMAKYNYFKVKTLIPIIMAITIPLMFMWVKDANIIYVTFIRVWIVMLGVMFMIPQNIFYRDIFKEIKGKYLIIGIANAVGAGFVGKLSPAIMFYLYYKYENMLMPAIYMSFIALMAGYFVWKSKKMLCQPKL